MRLNTSKNSEYTRGDSGISELLKIVNKLEKYELERENYLNKLSNLKKEELEDYLYVLKEITNLNLDNLELTIHEYNRARKEIKEVEKTLDNY